jgi:hypothetical protein
MIAHENKGMYAPGQSASRLGLARQSLHARLSLRLPAAAGIENPGRCSAALWESPAVAPNPLRAMVAFLLSNSLFPASLTKGVC